MLQPSRRKFLKISFKPLKAGKKEPKKSSLPRKTLDSDSRKIRIMGKPPPRLAANTFIGKVSLKSRDAIVNRLPKGDSLFLDKKVSGAQSLIHKDEASRFSFAVKNKGRIVRSKVATSLVRNTSSSSEEENKRLSHAKRLELFQALREKPLPFLDLHAQFGVTKETIRRLVGKRLLAEVWGPKAIGVRFKLTARGKTCLMKLEEAATCETKIKERATIRLKNKACA